MRTLTRSKAVTALTVGLIAAGGGIAYADNIQDDIVDSGAGVTLIAGSSTAGTANIKVVGNNSDGAVTDPGCNWDTGENPLVLDVVTPSGITATPDPLSITACGVDVPITLRASASAVSGTVTVAIVSTPAGGGGYNNQVSIPVTVTRPNTAPSVSVTGINAATYEIGSEPTPGCSVTDAQEPALSATPSLDRSGLQNGLGLVTVSCSVTDAGGLSDSDSASYTVVDTGDPTIQGSISPSTPDGAHGWYRSAPTVSFACADLGGSGVASCYVDGTASSSVTLSEGEDQHVTGTATDNAGNTATATVSGVDVDLTDPTTPTFSAFPAQAYFGYVPAEPTCASSDAVSGLAGCAVTGYSTALGTHKLTATATDNAGRTSTSTLSYTVSGWTLGGFYSPVDLGPVWNTVKGGATVPLKFEISAGATELTSTSSITSFRQQQVSCSSTGTTLTDAIEVTTTGGTTLRYDTTAGQFVQNWQTPKKAGTCYVVTVTTQDGSSISANFMLK